MCWSLTSSLVGASFSTLASLILLNSSSQLYRAYGYSILGITSMQWAEAYIWAFGNPGLESGDYDRCNLNNVIGTNIWVPLAIYGQALGPFWGFLRDFRAMWQMLYPFYLIVVPMCKLATVLFNPLLCTIVTPQGYLYWGAPTQLWPHILWWMIVSFPLFISKMLTGVRFVLWSGFGLAALLYSYAFTDSAGSNWCIYVTLYSLLGLVDYALFFDGRHPIESSSPHKTS